MHLRPHLLPHRDTNPSDRESWDILPPGGVLPYALDRPSHKPLVEVAAMLRSQVCGQAASYPVLLTCTTSY